MEISGRRKKHPWWAPGGIAGLIMDAKGEWIQEGGKWVWVKKEDLAEHEAEMLGRHYESPEYLQNAPSESSQPKPKPVPVPGGIPGPDPHFAGRYQSPSYLNPVPTVPEKAKPVTTPVKPPPETPKLGSIAPTIYAHKPDTSPPREIPAITTCTLCHGPVQNGECVQCSSKQCRGCGEMNFAMSKSCFSCGREL